MQSHKLEDGSFLTTPFSFTHNKNWQQLLAMGHPGDSCTFQARLEDPIKRQSTGQWIMLEFCTTCNAARARYADDKEVLEKYLPQKETE